MEPGSACSSDGSVASRSCRTRRKEVWAMEAFPKYSQLQSTPSKFLTRSSLTRSCLPPSPLWQRWRLYSSRGINGPDLPTRSKERKPSRISLEDINVLLKSPRQREDLPDHLKRHWSGTGRAIDAIPTMTGKASQ